MLGKNRGTYTAISQRSPSDVAKGRGSPGPKKLNHPNTCSGMKGEEIQRKYARSESDRPYNYGSNGRLAAPLP